MAQRLYRITSARPRLAFDAGHIPTVTAHLAAIQPVIAESGLRVLAKVSGELT